MTRVIFWRLVWKEYRVQRGFWIALAVFTLLGQVAVLTLPVPDLGRPAGLFGLATIIPVFYALGCGAMLFALESEEETADRLRIMAASPWGVLASKITFAVGSILALVAVVWIAALAFSRGRLPDPEIGGLLLPMGSVGLVEALAWATLFSLVSKKVIHAVVLAAAFWVISVAGFNWAYASQDPLKEGLAVPVTVRLAVAGLVMVTAAAIAGRWGRGPIGMPNTPTGLRLFGSAEARPRDRFARRSLLRGLAWQERRQAAKTILLLCGATYAIDAALILANLPPDREALQGVTVSALFLTALMGSCVFQAEQHAARFRFLAHRGASPLRVWWSKQLVWFPATLVAGWALPFLIVAAIAGELDEWGSFAALAGVFAFNYAAAQFVSILTPRALYAAFLAMVVAACLDGWIALMVVMDVNLWISVVPIPFLLFAASALRTRDWLLERKTWPARLRLAAALGFPTVALLSGVAAYRVHEIPVVEVPSALTEPMPPVTEAEKATADLYCQAIASLQPIDLPEDVARGETVITFGLEGWERLSVVEKAWLEQNGEAIGLALEASHRRGCVLQDPAALTIEEGSLSVMPMRELARLLLLDARRLEHEGRLEDALSRYVATVRMAHHTAQRGDALQFTIAVAIESLVCDYLPRWAAAPEQSREQVVRAIRELEELWQHPPSVVDAAGVEFRVHKGQLDRALAGDDSTDEIDLSSVELASFMPWERARAVRLYNAVVAHDLDRLQRVASMLEKGEPYRDIAPEPFAIERNDLGDRLQKWIRTTPLVLYADSMVPGTLESMTVDAETKRRATLVLLALLDYRHEHGRLPEQLETLVGTYFDELPIDPYTGGPFGYAPEGLGQRVYFNRPYDFVSEPDQPLLWASNQRDGFRRVQRGGEQVRQGEWAFPIP